MSALADAEVDRLWLGGDPAALGELHRRYHRRLEGVAYRVLGDASDAEDVVQRIFLALPNAAYRGTATLWTYLYRATLNGAVNVLRARRRRKALQEHELRRALAVAAAEEASNPEARVLEGEILGAVAKALLQVKPQHRRALVLRIVWDLSNTQIAEREGVPLATVGTWLRRGREELRAALGPILGDLGEQPR
ncbi:MAG TPA: sigma-70 family RNA polymerase sigma factor [Myxococcota bacterium]|nr:sigma-70 family RNA polymerase sigma factor [Myxococcota bacterium]